MTKFPSLSSHELPATLHLGVEPMRSPPFTLVCHNSSCLCISKQNVVLWEICPPVCPTTCVLKPHTLVDFSLFSPCLSLTQNFQLFKKRMTRSSLIYLPSIQDTVWHLTAALLTLGHQTPFVSIWCWLLGPATTSANSLFSISLFLSALADFVC